MDRVFLTFACVISAHAKDVPTFEGGQLSRFYFPETRVFECTDQCVFCETFSERHGFKVADAAP